MMSSTRQTLILLAFIFVSLAKTRKLGRHNFTSEWMVAAKDSLYPPLVTELKDLLVFVTFPSDYSIRLETSKIVNRPCQVPSRVMREHGGRNITPIYAETLGNGKIIVSLMGSKKRGNHMNIWLYVIDPENCTYDVDKFRLDPPKTLSRDVMTIVPYYDTFDIFLKSDIHCEAGNICTLSYDDKPSMIDSRRSVIPYEDEGWDITSVNDFDSNEGFLYIVMMSQTNTTVLKRLDSNFSLVRRAELNQSGSVAYWYDEDGSASLCFGASDQEIECLLLDADMRVKTEAQLYYDLYVSYYSIFRMRGGDAIVLTILSSDPDGGADSATYVQLVDGVTGAVGQPIKFQEYICENVFEMNTFELKERLVCASTICRSVVNTKCMAPEDERVF